MYIDENTKISKIITDTPESIEAIVSISKHFEKLRIPILRKTLASRVTIKQAAKIGGVSVSDFFEKLAPLGFTFQNNAIHELNEPDPEIQPNLETIDLEKVIELDVRTILKENKDPFDLIMDTLEKLPDEYALNIINTFEPIPLINILSKKGYTHHTNYLDKFIVHTYFKKEMSLHKPKNDKQTDGKTLQVSDLLNNYQNRIREIDVRNLEMPLPMSTILNELIALPENHLLYVHHKKVPKFLFPELSERAYQWHIQEIKEGDVKLFIFK